MEDRNVYATAASFEITYEQKLADSLLPKDGFQIVIFFPEILITYFAKFSLLLNLTVFDKEQQRTFEERS